MKKISLFIALALVGAYAGATEYRDFTSADGKTIRGKVIKYDGKQGTVMIERDNRKRATVPVNVFSTEDQTYIREWNAAQSFTSDKLLKIDFDSETVKKWKEDIYKDIRDTEGNVEEYLMKEIKYEDVAFEVEFRNMNKDTNLDGFRFEYRIYYEQSRENRDKQVPAQFVLGGESTVSGILAGKMMKITTDPVTIYEDNINAISWADGSERVGGEGDVHGIRARLYMKTKSGNEIMRECSYPSTLSRDDFPWKSKTGKPPAPVDSKR